MTSYAIFSTPHLAVRLCASVCVMMPYQSVVLCYKNKAVVVDEVAVNILLNRNVFLSSCEK